MATNGVLVLALIVDRNSNSRPSLDMAYRIRGIGNRQPNRLYMGKNVSGRGSLMDLSKIVTLRREQGEHCATRDYVLDCRQSQALVNDWQRRVHVLKQQRRDKKFINPYERHKAQR